VEEQNIQKKPKVIFTDGQKLTGIQKYYKRCVIIVTVGDILMGEHVHIKIKKH